MELFQFGTDPWGQQILIRLSWGLLTVSFWAGIAFILFHAVYAVVWKPKVAMEGGGGSTGVEANIPEKVVRHTGAARIFHWVMAAAMLILLATGFLPIIGLEFAWLGIHWISGVILILCILYHIVHASFFLDFWSIWILPSDLKEAVQRTKRQLGQPADVGKHAKYPLDHKLYHLAVSIFGLIVSATGILMMMRNRQPAPGPERYVLHRSELGHRLHRARLFFGVVCDAHHHPHLLLPPSREAVADQVDDLRLGGVGPIIWSTMTRRSGS